MDENNFYNPLDDEFLLDSDDSILNDSGLSELLSELDLDLFSEQPAIPGSAIDIDSPVKEVYWELSEPAEEEEEQAPRRRFKLPELPDFSELDRRTGMLAGLAVAAVVLIIATVFLFLRKNEADPYDNRILSNVSVAGVNVGGMTKSEALQAVKEAVGPAYEISDMVVTIGNSRLTLSPSSTNTKLNAEGAVEAAYNFGRSGSSAERHADYVTAQESGKVISLVPYLGMDTGYIRTTLKNEVRQYTDTFVPSGYTLEGEAPALDYEGFSASFPTQTLTLSVGAPGACADVDVLFNLVMDAYSTRRFSVTIGDEYLFEYPEKLDLDAIYNEICVQPVEAVVNGSELSSVVPGSYGYEFALEEAKTMMSGAGYGDEFTVPMYYVYPQNVDSVEGFYDTLGSFSSPVSENEDYNNNMRLVIQAIDGIVIKPGETFSLNSTTGTRTTDKGYTEAPLHAGICIEKTVGGGVDQVASALFASAVYADLAFSERNPAHHLCSYNDPGANVHIGNNAMDLKLRNTGKNPVMIRAAINNSAITVRIMGTDTNDCIVKMETTSTPGVKFSRIRSTFPASSGYNEGDIVQFGQDGIQLTVFRVYYSKATGEKVKRVNEWWIGCPSLSEVTAHIEG